MEGERQEPLWHDTIEDALRSVIDALGGFKKVGAILWPALPADDAARKLAKCLDRGRPEKLEYGEILLILTKGREAGCHVGMHFVCQATGYRPPEPQDPVSEFEKLQRDFIASTEKLSRLADRIDQARLKLRIAS